jgi:hypothetical protein
LHAFILLAMNRDEEGLQEQKRSSEMDPFARPWALGWAYILTRQYDAAIKELRPWAETVPEDSYVHGILSAAYEGKGMERQSIGEAEKAIRLISNEKTAAEIDREFEKGWKEGRSRVDAEARFSGPRPKTIRFSIFYCSRVCPTWSQGCDTELPGRRLSRALRAAHLAAERRALRFPALRPPLSRARNEDRSPADILNGLVCCRPSRGFKRSIIRPDFNIRSFRRTRR